MISSVELVSLCFLKLEHLPKWLCASKLKRSDGGDGALLNYALARKTICARDFTLPYYYSMIERLSIQIVTPYFLRETISSQVFISAIHWNLGRSEGGGDGASIIFGQRDWLWAWAASYPAFERIGWIVRPITEKYKTVNNLCQYLTCPAKFGVLVRLHHVHYWKSIFAHFDNMYLVQTGVQTIFQASPN